MTIAQWTVSLHLRNILPRKRITVNGTSILQTVSYLLIRTTPWTKFKIQRKRLCGVGLPQGTSKVCPSLSEIWLKFILIYGFQLWLRNYHITCGPNPVRNKNILFLIILKSGPFNGPTPASPFIFGLFKQTIQFYNKSMWKMSCPSYLRLWDLNPWPLKHESSPITTRPGLCATYNSQNPKLFVEKNCCQTSILLKNWNIPSVLYFVIFVWTFNGKLFFVTNCDGWIRTRAL